MTFAKAPSIALTLALVVLGAVAASTARATPDGIFCIVTGADPDALHIPPLKESPEHPHKHLDEPGDLLLKLTYADHKRFFLADRPRECLRAVTVTPDGAHVVCLADPDQNLQGPKGRETDVIVVLSSAGGLESVTRLSDNKVQVRSAPELLPGGKRLGFQTRRTTEQRDPLYGDRMIVDLIVTTDLAGGDVKPIGPGLMPTWTADGRTILYTAPRKLDDKHKVIEGCRLMMMDADGSHPRPIGPPDSADGSFSPDGKHVAYLKLAPGHTEVYVANAADGSGARKVSVTKAIYTSPRWLDDNRLLVAASREVVPDIVDGKPAPLPRKDAEGPNLNPDALFVLEGDGLTPAHRLLPRMEAKHGVDFLGASIVSASLPRDAVADRRKQDEAAAPVPEGYTLVFRGTKAYLQDSAGKLKPAPDGNYRLPGGGQVLISAGKKTIRSSGDDGE